MPGSYSTSFPGGVRTLRERGVSTLSSAEGDFHMKILISTLILILALSASNQQGGATQHDSTSQQMAPRANEGHLPPPPPAKGSNPREVMILWFTRIRITSAGICYITSTPASTFTFNIWKCCGQVDLTGISSRGSSLSATWDVCPVLTVQPDRVAARVPRNP